MSYQAPQAVPLTQRDRKALIALVSSLLSIILLAAALIMPWWGMKSDSGGGSTYNYRLTGVDISLPGGSASHPYGDILPGDARPFREIATQTVGVYDATLYLSAAALVLCIFAFILAIPASMKITRPLLPAILHLVTFLAALSSALFFMLQLPAAMQADLNSGRPLHIMDNFIGTLGDSSCGPGPSWFLMLAALPFLLAGSVVFFNMGRMKAKPHVEYVQERHAAPPAVPPATPELQVIEIVEEYEYIPPDAPPEFVKAVEESKRKSAGQKAEYTEANEEELPPPPDD